MLKNGKYIFKSERLGFRQWISADINVMAEINSDVNVMEFFPGTQSKKQTADFIERMQNQFIEKGYCYFAITKLQNDEFIGFIGLSDKDFESDFTPCIDIGWRLKREEWNKGFATEGAKKCLDYAFDRLMIKKVNSIAPSINFRSEQVMKKIGMKKVRNLSIQC